MLVMGDTVTVDLSKGIRRSSVDIGEADSYANRFGAKVVVSDKLVDLSGASAQGVFIREDRETIDVQGSVENDLAFVVLPPECYAVVGRYQLTLKLVSGDAKITLRIIEGRVLRTRASGSGSGGGTDTSQVFYTADGEAFYTIDEALLHVKGGL